MKAAIRILILGLNYPVPTFIKRRLKKLDEVGIQLIIINHNNSDFLDFKNANLVQYQKVTWSKPVALVYLLVSFIFNFRVNTNLWKLSGSRKGFNRLKWCLENQQLTGKGHIDLIHLQWLSAQDRYKLLHKFYPQISIVVSARGSQLTVHPQTNVTAMESMLFNFSEADFIHAVSHELATHCINLGADKSKIIVNYNGIDLLKFRPSTKKKSSLKFRLVSVGSLIWRKGYLYQLQILKQLAGQNLNISLHIIGSGPDEVALKYTALRMGIEKDVFFEGQKNESEIISLLHSSDLFISTSAAEGLPNSLVEAAACGLPLVTFKCEGVAEIIEDQMSGYIVDFGDINAFANKILYLAKNSEVCSKMGAKSRRKIESQFDEDFWVNKMTGFYRQAVLKNRS